MQHETFLKVADETQNFLLPRAQDILATSREDMRLVLSAWHCSDLEIETQLLAETFIHVPAATYREKPSADRLRLTLSFEKRFVWDYMGLNSSSRRQTAATWKKWAAQLAAEKDMCFPCLLQYVGDEPAVAKLFRQMQPVPHPLGSEDVKCSFELVQRVVDVFPTMVEAAKGLLIRRQLITELEAPYPEVDQDTWIAIPPDVEKHFTTPLLEHGAIDLPLDEKGEKGFKVLTRMIAGRLTKDLIRLRAVDRLRRTLTPLKRPSNVLERLLPLIQFADQFNCVQDDSDSSIELLAKHTPNPIFAWAAAIKLFQARARRWCNKANDLVYSLRLLWTEGDEQQLKAHIALVYQTKLAVIRDLHALLARRPSLHEGRPTLAQLAWRRRSRWWHATTKEADVCGCTRSVGAFAICALHALFTFAEHSA